LGFKFDGLSSGRTQLVFSSSLLGMKPLPQTGTAALLELLSPHLDDAFINDLFPRQPRQGRHASYSPAQLLRVQLLQLLTPAHSGNLLIQLLPENRRWRDFARLPNKRCLPDAKMLHQFRDRLDLIKLRQINRQLLTPILAGLDPARKTVAIMDATDLPASTNCFKKKACRSAPLYGRRSAPGRSKAGRVAGLSATKSTRSVCGWEEPPAQSCSRR
jgi:hypothetical protein